ncbi:MAG: hypothetical protein ACP5NV_06395 [Candidatus Woesearchaeota archaeon]
MLIQEIIEKVNSNVAKYQENLASVILEMLHSHEMNLKIIGDEITVESVIAYVKIDKIITPKYDIYEIRQYGDPLPEPSNGIYQSVKDANKIFEYNEQIIADLGSLRLVSQPEKAIINYTDNITIREFSKKDSTIIYTDLYSKVISAIDTLRHEVETEENSDLPF